MEIAGIVLGCALSVAALVCGVCRRKLRKIYEPQIK